MLGDDFKSIAVLYRRILVLIVISWSVYPILFIFGPNGSVTSGGAITSVTTVCDLFSKGLSGLMFSFAKRSLTSAQDKLHGIGEEEDGSSCFGLCHEEPKHKHAPAQDPAQMMAMIQMMMAQQMQQLQQPQPQMQQDLQAGAVSIEMQPQQIMTPRTAVAQQLQQFTPQQQWNAPNASVASPPMLSSPSMSQANLMAMMMQNMQMQQQSPSSASLSAAGMMQRAQSSSHIQQ